MEVDRVFFDVSFNGQEVLVDKGGDFSICVGFGLQPNASASGRRGAEVNEERSVLLLCLGQSGISIFFPFDSHLLSPPRNLN
jgi:hypothetical protein